MRTALFWVVTQRVVVIPYRRFGTTYRFHLSTVNIFIFYTCSSLLSTTRSRADCNTERHGVNTAPILKFSVLFTVHCASSGGVKRFNGFWIAFHYSQAASNLCSNFLLSPAQVYTHSCRQEIPNYVLVYPSFGVSSN